MFGFGECVFCTLRNPKSQRMIYMAETNLKDAVLIDRTDIAAILFPEDDVLDDIDQIKDRSRKIHRATSLGNLEHRKVHIVFRDIESLKRVHTTIWVQLGEKIILKERIMLPVNRIVDIVFD
jgi:hypothetical protein